MSRLGTTAGPFFVGTEVAETENGGSETVELWQGSETECRAKMRVLKALAATSIRLSAGPGGDWQVRATFPFGDEEAEKPVDTMELDTNAVMRSVYQSPVFRSRFTDYDATTHHSTRAMYGLGIIRDCSQKYQRGLTAAELSYNGVGYSTAEEAILAEVIYRATHAAVSPAYTDAEAEATIQLFYNVAFRQVTSFIEYQQVFRRTVTAGTPAAVKANFTGVGKIWTTAEVIAWEKIPADGWFTLPAGAQWHKDKPSVVKVYGQKTQLTYHYTEIKTASALLYEAYGTATLIDLPTP